MHAKPTCLFNSTICKLPVQPSIKPSLWLHTESPGSWHCLEHEKSCTRTIVNLRKSHAWESHTWESNTWEKSCSLENVFKIRLWLFTDVLFLEMVLTLHSHSFWWKHSWFGAAVSANSLLSILLKTLNCLKIVAFTYSKPLDLTNHKLPLFNRQKQCSLLQFLRQIQCYLILECMIVTATFEQL